MGRLTQTIDYYQNIPNILGQQSCILEFPGLS